MEDEVIDDLLRELTEDAAQHLDACLQQAAVREKLQKKETEAAQKLAAISIQRIARTFLARRVLHRIKEKAAALHIQRLARARLARNEVNALKLQRDALDVEAAPSGVVIRKHSSSFDQDTTTKLTYLKAGLVLLEKNETTAGHIPQPRNGGGGASPAFVGRSRVGGKRNSSEK